MEVRWDKPACEGLDVYSVGKENHQERAGGEGRGNTGTYVVTCPLSCMPLSASTYIFRLPLCGVFPHARAWTVTQVQVLEALTSLTFSLLPT